MNPYKTFPNANLIREWDKLLKLNREEVVSLHDTWEDIHKQNYELGRKLMNEKLERQKEVDDYMESNNVDIWNYKRNHFTLEQRRNGYQSWYKKNVADKISEKYPYYSNQIPTAHMDSVEVDGIILSNNQSPTNIVELYDKMKREYNSKMNEISLKDKLLVESIKYANTHGLDIRDLSAKDIISIVDDHAKDEFRKENFPDGTEIYLKHGCDECSTYTVGDHRCSCGNRRIMMVVDGNLVEGYDCYPEAY